MIKRHTDFQDMMNVSIETEDKWLNRKLNSHICYGKGGGGGGGNQQQDVPPTLRPYVTDVLNRAKALYGAETQYQPYQGERVVPFTAEELAAQEGITGMVGRGISQDPFLSSAGAYYAPAYGLLGEAGALQAGAAREITADEIMGRMSPYQQAVTDITKREAMKEAQLYGQKLKGQAATTGGFGGSRQAILEAQAAADLGGRLTDIQARGQQEAYMNALQMAEQQRAREMGAGQALSGLSGMYGNLGQQALGQAYRELGYLSGVGEAQRGMGQQRADIAYQDFMAQRDFPDTQLQKYSSLIQGFPFQFNMPGMQPSQFQQTVGAATALGGLGRGLGFFTQGGQVEAGGKKYPNTGLAALAQERPDVVKKMGYKDGGTVYRQPGGKVKPGMLDFSRGTVADLYRQYENETDYNKKQELLKQLQEATSKQAAEENILSKMFDPDVMSPYRRGQLYLQEKPTDTGASSIAKSVGRSALELVDLPFSFLKSAAGAGREIDEVFDAGLTSVARYLTSPVGKPKEAVSSMPPAGFTGETPLPEYPDYLKERDEKDAEKAVADAEKILADKKSKDNKPTESVEDLEKVLEEAYKFDREAKEKAIKSQQGFDVAALGLQLMSTPLSKIDPRMISQLGVSQKELAGLSEEEAKQKLQKALTRIAIKKSKADIAKTEAEAEKGLSEANWYREYARNKEAVGGLEPKDIQNILGPTILLSAEELAKYSTMANEYALMLNQQNPEMSKEEKEIKLSEYVKSLKKGSGGIPGRPIQRTSTRLAINE